MNKIKSIQIGLLLATLFCFPAFVNAQGLTVNNSQLNFGVAFENAPDSLQLTISNPTTKNIFVNAIKFYTTYGQPAFSVDASAFLIPASASQNVWVKFSPRHNIFHNSEMVIVNDGLRGYVNVDLIGQGRFSNSYYDLTENTSEEALKTTINTITGAGYLSLGYNVARDNMFMNIDNQRTNGQGAVQNTLECVYTGRTAVGYVDRTDCQNNYAFNTEHTFPQSFFLSAEPMKSDLHHLFPTDNTANNVRADNPFAVVTNPTWTVGGSKSNGSTFEPRDQQKGRVARALFYFVLRYQNYANFITQAQENVLRTWSMNFPVTDVDKRRLDDIQLVQRNRNPFVDYPQFIERIHSFISTSVDPANFSFDLTQDTIIYGYIPISTPTDFNYVLVNKGNTQIDISSIQVTHPAEMTIISGGGNSTLQSGDASNIVIRYNSITTDSVRAFLSFQLNETNGVGSYAASIPIFVNDNFFNSVNDIDELSSLVYPNPVHDQLVIESKNQSFDVLLMDVEGRVVKTATVSKGERVLISTESLSPGTYILKQSTSMKVYYSKLIVY